MNERTIFLNSLNLPSAEARAKYLDEVCADNPELRQRVMSLLKAHAAEGVVDALAANVDEQTSSMLPEESAPRPEADVEPEPLDFLGPCASPGCIGSLGSYEIIEVLGRGGMGVVFRARDPKLQRIVAIKVLAPEIAANKTAKKRFEREAQAAAAVSHDHIVTIHAVDEFHNLPYLVMECVVGRSLQQKIEETGPLELKEILRIGMQTALGLAAAHKQGLVHRDIKPANILLQNGVQRVKITDFGLARATDDVGMTHTGQIAGTPMYMSPEQAQGQKVDHLSDLFSLGSVLYTMCTGRPAFRAPNTVAVLRRVCDDPPRPILEVNPELPVWLVDIVNKLMSKNKEDRYQSAAEVADLLSEYLSLVQMKGQTSSVDSTRLARPAGAIQAEQAPGKLSLPPKSSNKSPSKGILLALLLGVLVMSPILFGRHLSDRFNQWLWPAIPTLPSTELTTGLNFDGKDDSVEFAPVDWSFPQFTIEAFVTSAQRSDNGTIVSLTSAGQPWEIMELYDGHQADAGKRLSGAQIMGKTPYATAYGPLTPGVRQHRALVFDGSYMHFYINGIWQGKRRAEAHEAMMWKMKQLRLGCDGDGKKSFEGRIDQVRISKVARYRNNFAPLTSVASDERTLALFNFDERKGDVVNDSSGNGNHGTIVGAKWASPMIDAGQTSQPLAPPVAYVLKFDGTDDRVDLPPLDISRDAPLTIEAIVELDVRQLWGVIATTHGMALTVQGLQAQFGGAYPGGVPSPWVRSPTQSIPLRRPVHLAGVRDGKHVRLFVDGKLADQNEHGQLLMVNPGTTTIGDHGPWVNHPLHGMLQLLRISTSARYVTEFTPATSYAPDQHTAALYYFDEGTGDTLKDHSGNGRDGKIVGATWVRADRSVQAVVD